MHTVSNNIFVYNTDSTEYIIILMSSGEHIYNSAFKVVYSEDFNYALNLIY